MSYSKLILRDSAEIVWPLDDITESSSVSKAINFYNSNILSNSASINISQTDIVNNPIIFGGGKSLRFTSSSVGLSIPALNRFSELYQNKNSYISFWFQTDYLSTQETPIFKKRGFSNIGLFIKDNYLMFRYGTSASYTEVAGDLSNPEEPNHIVVGKNDNSLVLIINGTTFTNSDNFIYLDKDISHSNNNYLDFYGPSNGNWIIDCLAIYSNTLRSSDAKKHYVYGLGKSIGEDIFNHRGGSIYNFSTINTEKLLSINWSYPQQWFNSTLTNLNNNVFGIQPLKFSEPEFYSYNSDIQKSSNQITFKDSSGSSVNAAYIDIYSLFNKINAGEYPIFIKIKLDGNLPKVFEKQRILSFGQKPDNEILQFNFYNNSGSYTMLIQAYDSSSVSFNISNIQSQPDIYIGMKFDQYSRFYFCQTASSIIEKTFNYKDNNGYGVDPLTPYLPPSNNFLFRIGSAIKYDKTNYSINLPDINQFSGTFKKLFIHDKDFTSSVSFSYLENYKKSKYEISFNTALNRFKVFSYGTGTFNIHAIDMAEFINDTEQKLGSNIITFGYPDISSSSQVSLYVTHLDYNDTILYPKTKINHYSTIPFINNKNISGTYLKFDFEIAAEDSNYYPPKIKYFAMETYKATNNTTVLRHDDGMPYILYQSSSSIYLPEIKQTPNIFLTKYSGLKLLNNNADFTDNISSKLLDPRTITGLKVWLDSRFINGLNKINLEDDSRVTVWNNLLNNNIVAQNSSASAPVFRIQSLNIFNSNQLNGTESGSTTGVTAVNSSIISSPDGAISGQRGIKIIPSGSSIDSYIQLNNNTASISIFPNQSYSVVGTIKIPFQQSASAFHDLSKKIAVYLNNGSGLVFSASSVSASNTPGSYNLSTSFITSSVTQSAEVRFYNGSYNPEDIVFWDNLGLYPINSGSFIFSWRQPLTTDNDSPTIKFNLKEYLNITASVSQPYSLYSLFRVFGDGSIISNNSNILYSNSGSYYFSSGSAVMITGINNKFNLLSVLVNNTSASFYINKQFIKSGNVGANKLDITRIGNLLPGDINNLLVYEGIHSLKDKERIENWIYESFNLE